MKKLIFLIHCMFAVSGICKSQSISRGPYLQLRTQTSIQIRYRTNSAYESRVKIGTSPNSLTTEFLNSSLKNDHVVNITGLSANTKYYYAILNGAQALQGNEINYFVTTQNPNMTQKIRIWATGDCVTPNIIKNKVRNSFLNYVGTNYIDAWLLLGDNSYPDGLQHQYQESFFNVYQGDRIMKQTNIYPAPGNHDYAGNTRDWNDHNIPYYEIFANAGNTQMGGVASNHKEYYSYDIGNAHFISLDSYGKETANNWVISDTLSPQIVWLKADLAANSKKWTIVYFHHPPYSMGTHNSDTENDLVLIRERLVPILERYNVDLVLTAHSHNYERSKLMKGHFGLEGTFNSTLHLVSTSSGYYDGSANSCPYHKKSNGSVKGTVYAVSGSSAEVLYEQSSFPHEALPFGEPDYGGSVYIEIENNRLDFKMIGENGDIRDKFTMVKDMNQMNTVNVTSGDQLATIKSPYLEPSHWVSSPTIVPSINIPNPVTGMRLKIWDTKGCFTDTLIINTLNPCISNQIVDSPVEVSSIIDLKTANPINASSILSTNTNVIFDSKQKVMLLPGFETKVGTVFTAKIGGCINSSQ